jgi:hypothetical protein
MATLVITLAAANSTTVTQTYSSADAQRYFNAWKNTVGPKDPSGNPIGTQQDMTSYISEAVIHNLDHLITIYEQQAVIPPVTTPS